MDKEQLNSKIKEIVKQDDVHAKKAKEKQNEVSIMEKVKENIKKAKNCINKAIDKTKNSSIVKKVTTGQKFAALGVAAVVLIVIIALIGRFIFSPCQSIWCVTDAPKTELAFNSAGEVAEVAYSEKQIVPNGDIIARIQDDALIAELESAASKSIEANWKYFKMENRLAEMENAIAESKLKTAENEKEAAATALELASAYEAQYRSFLINGEISQAQYSISLRDKTDAEAALDRTKDQLERVKQNLETVKNGHTPDEIENAKQEADIAAEQVAKAKVALDGASITAPFNAYINKINMNVGDKAEPGMPVCEVVDLSKTWLRGVANKAMVESLKPGSVVNVEFQEIPNEMFTGKIVSIASQPEQTEKGEDLYELRIELDNPGSYILPEMEAIAIVVSS